MTSSLLSKNNSAHSFASETLHERALSTVPATNATSYGAARDARPSRFALVATLLIAGLSAGACNLLSAPQDFGGLPIPSSLGLQDLDETTKSRIFATLEIGDNVKFLEETRLEISPDFSAIRGEFNINESFLTEDTQTPFMIRLWLAKATPDENDVLLARALGETTLQLTKRAELALPAGEDVYDTCGGSEGVCELLFDLNRNGRPNLEDLRAGIEPTPPAPFVDISPSTLQFPSGIRPGNFARQVIVVENTTSRPIEAEAKIINGAGVTLSRYESDGEAEIETGKRVISLGTVGPFEERFLAVSFAPVNAYLTTGDVFLSLRDPQSGVKQASRVKVIANADGELQPEPLDFAPEALREGAILGGYKGEVTLFPAEELWNGLALTSLNGNQNGLAHTHQKMRAVFDGDKGPEEIPVDAAMLVEVEAQHRLSLSLGGLATDIDMAAFWLDATDSISDDPNDNQLSARSGKSPEAIEVRNASNAPRRLLLTLGRIETEGPADLDGAVSHEESAPLSLSGQQGNPPEITSILPSEGPLEGGNRVQIRGRGFQDGATITFSNAVALDCTLKPVERSDEENVNQNDDAGESSIQGESIFDCTAPTGSLELGKNPATVVVLNPNQDVAGDGQAASFIEGYTYLPPAPRLDELSPQVAPTEGSAGYIAVLGRFFSTRHGLPRVHFGDVVVEVADSVTDERIRFIDSGRVDVKAPGIETSADSAVVTVYVENRLADDPVTGQKRWSLPSNVRNFTYIKTAGPPPNLTSVSPNTGSIDGGKIITLSDGSSDETTEFVLGAQVLFDGRPAGDVTFAGPKSLTATLPPRTAPGLVDVEVINPDGQSSRLQDAFEYIIPAPTVSNVFPPQASTVGGTFVVVNGTGFRAGVQVIFEAQDGTLAYSPNVNRVSTQTVLAATPAVSEGGEYVLIVLNVDGKLAEWSEAFTYVVPDGAPPVVESIEPPVGYNDTPQDIVLTGKHFRGPPTVLLGNEPATLQEFIDCADYSPPDGGSAAVDCTNTETRILKVSSPITTTEGPVVVRVINSDGQSDTSVFTYVRRLGQPPQIFGVDPPQGGAGQLITLSGVNFAVNLETQEPEADLIVRGTKLSSEQITFFTDSRIQFEMPTIATAVPLNVEITVRNPDEQRSSGNFLYIPNANVPTAFVSTVAPAGGPVGTDIVVTGAYLDIIDRVFIGQQSVSSDNFSIHPNGTSIEFTVPELPLGAAVIRLVDDDTERTITATFTVVEAEQAPLRVYAISPSETPPTGGVEVVLTGSGFHADSVLRVAGQIVSAFQVEDEGNTLRFTAPAHPNDGMVFVTIENLDGQMASIPFRYKTPVVIEGEPEISLVMPDQISAIQAEGRFVVLGQNLGNFASAALRVDSDGYPVAAVAVSETRLELTFGGAADTNAPTLPYGIDAAASLQLSFENGAVLAAPLEIVHPRVQAWFIDAIDQEVQVFGQDLHPETLRTLRFYEEQEDANGAIIFALHCEVEVGFAADEFALANLNDAECTWENKDYELRLAYGIGTDETLEFNPEADLARPDIEEEQPPPNLIVYSVLPAAVYAGEEVRVRLTEPDVVQKIDLNLPSGEVIVLTRAVEEPGAIAPDGGPPPESTSFRLENGEIIFEVPEESEAGRLAFKISDTTGDAGRTVFASVTILAPDEKPDLVLYSVSPAGGQVGDEIWVRLSESSSITSVELSQGATIVKTPSQGTSVDADTFTAAPDGVRFQIPPEASAGALDIQLGTADGRYVSTRVTVLAPDEKPDLVVYSVSPAGGQVGDEIWVRLSESSSITSVELSQGATIVKTPSQGTSVDADTFTAAPDGVRFQIPPEASAGALDIQLGTADGRNVSTRAIVLGADAPPALVIYSANPMTPSAGDSIRVLVSDPERVTSIDLEQGGAVIKTLFKFEDGNEFNPDSQFQYDVEAVFFNAPPNVGTGELWVRLNTADEDRFAYILLQVPTPPPMVIYAVSPARMAKGYAGDLSVRGEQLKLADELRVEQKLPDGSERAQSFFRTPGEGELGFIENEAAGEIRVELPGTLFLEAGSVSVLLFDFDTDPEGQASAFFQVEALVPSFELVSPTRVYAQVPYETVRILGNDLSDASSVSVVLVNNDTLQNIPGATLVGKSAEWIDVELPKLDDTNASPSAHYEIEVGFEGETILRSPAFEAAAPVVVYGGQTSYNLAGIEFIFMGEHFNPKSLVGYTLQEGDAQAIEGDIELKSDGLVRGVLAGALFPGATYALKLVHEFTSTTDPTQPPEIVTVDPGHEFVHERSLGFDFRGQLASTTDLSGRSFSRVVNDLHPHWDAINGNQTRNVYAVRVDGNVGDAETRTLVGTWSVLKNSSRLEAGEVTINWTSEEELAKGEYRLVLAVSRPENAAEADFMNSYGGLYIVEPIFFNNDEVSLNRGDALLLAGALSSSSIILATNTVETTTVEVGTNASFAINDKDSLYTAAYIRTERLDAGTWDICVAESVSATCAPENSKRVALSDSPNCTRDDVLDLATTGSGQDEIFNVLQGGIFEIALNKSLAHLNLGCRGPDTSVGAEDLHGAVLQVDPALFAANQLTLRVLESTQDVDIQLYQQAGLCAGGTQLATTTRVISGATTESISGSKLVISEGTSLSGSSNGCLPLAEVDTAASGWHVPLDPYTQAKSHQLVFVDTSGSTTSTMKLQIGIRNVDKSCVTPDSDGDGYGPCEDDCNDNVANINSFAAEQCDFVDHNCDGQQLILGPCNTGDSGVCSDGLETCSEDENEPGTLSGTSSCVAVRGASSFEVCGNGLDDDCNTTTTDDSSDCKVPGAFVVDFTQDSWEEDMTGASEHPVHGYGEQYGPVQLPFVFPYYGQMAKEVYLHTAGAISFAPTSVNGGGSNSGNISLPGQTGAVVAFANTYLRSNRQSSVLTKTVGTTPERVFVIEYNHFDYDDSGWGAERNSVSVQIKLYEANGEIDLVYRNLWGNPNQNITQGFGDWVGYQATLVSPAHANNHFGAREQVVRYLPKHLGPDCGDRFCDAFAGEDPNSCSVDCSDVDANGVSISWYSATGNGRCESYNEGGFIYSNELYSALEDCGYRCGNGVCESDPNNSDSESAATCPEDCGTNRCGNGTCDIYEVTKTLQDGTSITTSIDENLYCYQDCSNTLDVDSDYDDDGDGIKSSVDFFSSQEGSYNECKFDPDCDDDLLLDGLEIPDPDVTALQLSFEIADADQDFEPDGAEVLGGSSGSRDPLNSEDGLYAAAGEFCGDGTCQSVVEGQPFESPANCIADCWCGNYTCEETKSETGQDANGNALTHCPSDCYCGNGSCDANESAESCESDCGDGADTGNLNPNSPDPNQAQCNLNGTCEEGETPESCSDCQD